MMAGVTFTNTSYDANNPVQLERIAEQMGIPLTGITGWMTPDEVRNQLFPGQTPAQINDAFYKFRTTPDASYATWNGLPTGSAPVYYGNTQPSQIKQSGAGGAVGGPLVQNFPYDPTGMYIMAALTAGVGGAIGAAGAAGAGGAAAAGGLGDTAAFEAGASLVPAGGAAAGTTAGGGMSWWDSFVNSITGGDAASAGVTDLSNLSLPPTVTGMPGADVIGSGSGINAGLPLDTSMGNWWSDLGLSSDPTITADTFSVNPSTADLGGNIGSGMNLPNLPSGIQNLVKSLLSSPGGAQAVQSAGGLGNLLKSLGIDSSGILGQGLSLAAREAPGLMALDYAKSQGNDLQSILDQLKGNQSAVVKAATDPLQANIAAGYGDLVQSLGLRGVRGSSFGDTDIANYLARTGTSLANAGANAAEGSLALQGDLTAKAQALKNSLYGRAFDVLGRGLNPAGWGTTALATA